MQGNSHASFYRPDAVLNGETVRHTTEPLLTQDRFTLGFDGARESRLSYWMTTLGLSDLSPFTGPLAFGRAALPSVTAESRRIKVISPSFLRLRIVTGICYRPRVVKELERR